MKVLIATLLLCLSAGCALNTSGIAHEDSVASPPPTAGPELCKDGTPPPCTPRS